MDQETLAAPSEEETLLVKEGTLDTEEPAFYQLPRFRVWKKHVRCLYQLLFFQNTHHPTGTIQILPYVRHSLRDQLVEHYILSGSNDTNAQNYVYLFKAVSPPPFAARPPPFDSETGEFGGYGHAPSGCGLAIDLRIYHDGGVCRARYVPVNPNLFVTSSTTGKLYVFDKTEIARSRKPNNPPRPTLPAAPSDDVDLTVEGPAQSVHLAKKMRYERALDEQSRFDRERGVAQHKLTLTTESENESGTYALDVSQCEQGTVCAGHGTTVRCWNITDYEGLNGSSLSPFFEREQPGTVNDVCFDKNHSSIFYTVTEHANALNQIDTRGKSSNCIAKVALDEYGVSIDSNHYHPESIVVGRGDGKVDIWDTRHTIRSLHTWEAHLPQTEVSTVSYNPHCASLLATGGEDCETNLWNITTSGVQREQTTTSTPSGSISAAELIFCHGGHTAPVTDVAWSWSEAHKGMMATCSAGDQLLMLWRPRNYVWNSKPQTATL